MNNLIILAIFSFIFSYSNKNGITKNDLFPRHWAGSCNNVNCDTMTFGSHKKYNAKFYQWGAYAEGFEFNKDGTVSTFHNIHCSNESSPVDNYVSNWYWMGKDSLVIDNRIMNITYKVISLNKNELRIKLLNYKMKPDK
jgi:hypothetical protein